MIARLYLILFLSATAPIALTGCTGSDGTGGGTGQGPSQQIFETSLHYTREGKQIWNTANGGFETLTGLKVEDLGCVGCHAPTKADGTPIDDANYKPDCADCHAKPGDKPDEAICLKCHSRQAAERKFYTDVHQAKGFQCRDCHKGGDVHGDGVKYTSWLQPGAVDITCEKCHGQTAAANIPEHTQHGKNIDCGACHMQSVITCYNCHIKSAEVHGAKRANTQFRGYQLLVNRVGYNKVYAGTFMTAQYNDKTWFVIAPYRAHTITKKGKVCADCHGNANVQQYVDTGKIVLVKWDEALKKATGPSGVVPVPPDWQTAFQVDFVDYTGDPHNPNTDPTKWVYLKTGFDGSQKIWAEPLTEAQMNALKTKY